MAESDLPTDAEASAPEKSAPAEAAESASATVESTPPKAESGARLPQVQKLRREEGRGAGHG